MGTYAEKSKIMRVEKMMEYIVDNASFLDVATSKNICQEIILRIGRHVFLPKTGVSSPGMQCERFSLVECEKSCPGITGFIYNIVKSYIEAINTPKNEYVPGTFV